MLIADHLPPYAAMAEPLELIQFPYSHYNEKVRWALDLKRPPHQRTDLVPGPHAMTALRLTGQTQVPIMRFGREYVPGSADILARLEQRFPLPPLYPSDPESRARAVELQRFFDEDIGPMVRRGVFAVLTREPDYLCAMFTQQKGSVARSLYRAVFPLTKWVMASSMGISDAASIDLGIERTRAGFDFVARESAATGYLVGDGFCVADLTAAALLAPAVMPEGSPMALPEPRPATLRQWLDRWADHPGAMWVRRIYRNHRGV